MKEVCVQREMLKKIPSKILEKMKFMYGMSSYIVHGKVGREICLAIVSHGAEYILLHTVIDLGGK